MTTENENLMLNQKLFRVMQRSRIAITDCSVNLVSAKRKIRSFSIAIMLHVFPWNDNSLRMSLINWCECRVNKWMRRLPKADNNNINQKNIRAREKKLWMETTRMVCANSICLRDSVTACATEIKFNVKS